MLGIQLFTHLIKLDIYIMIYIYLYIYIYIYIYICLYIYLYIYIRLDIRQGDALICVTSRKTIKNSTINLNIIYTLSE